MKVRVYQEPSGNVRILRLNGRQQNAGETEDAFLARIAAGIETNDLSLQGLPFTDLDETDIPTDRTERYKWRLKTGKCVVDKTIPNLPHPKQALIDRTNQANSVAELKAILLDILK